MASDGELWNGFSDFTQYVQSGPKKIPSHPAVLASRRRHARLTGLWQATDVTTIQMVSTMARPIEALELELLRLPTSERVRLLDRVIASLDADKARDRAWDELAAKRDAEIERGESSQQSGPEVLARLRAELD